MLRNLILKIPFTWLRIITWDHPEPPKGNLVDIIEVNWLLDWKTSREYLQLAIDRPEARHVIVSPNNTTTKSWSSFFLKKLYWRVK